MDSESDSAQTERMNSKPRMIITKKISSRTPMNSIAVRLGVSMENTLLRRKIIRASAGHADAEEGHAANRSDDAALAIFIFSPLRRLAIAGSRLSTKKRNLTHEMTYRIMSTL